MTPHMNITGDVAAYAELLTAAGRSPHTITQYTCWPRRLLADMDLEVAEVTEEHVVVWLSLHPDWTATTRNKCVAALKRFFDWTRRTGRTPGNPAENIPTPRLPHRVPVCCPEDVYTAALHTATGDNYWRLRMCADTGMRCAELAGCTADDLRAGPAVLVRGKGGRQRLVPVPADVAVWLQARGSVWDGRTPGAVSLAYRRLLGGQWGAHSLRHRYATRVYRATHDLESLRLLLGHASIATTQQYLTTEQDTLQAAAAACWAA